MDALEQFVVGAEISAAVFGKGEEFVLVPLCEREPAVSEAQAAEFHARRFQFCGVMGYANGQCSARCEPGLDAISTMMAAAVPFAQYVAGILKADPLERWYKMPDPRTVN